MAIVTLPDVPCIGCGKTVATQGTFHVDAAGTASVIDLANVQSSSFDLGTPDAPDVRAYWWRVCDGCIRAKGVSR